MMPPLDVIQTQQKLGKQMGKTTVKAATGRTMVSLRLENDMLELIRDMADNGRRPFTTQMIIILEKGLEALEPRARRRRRLNREERASV